MTPTPTARADLSDEWQPKPRATDRRYLPRKYRPVAGVYHRGERRVVISFDDDTLADINAGAKANDCSFSSYTRMLIEVGLETIAQADE